MIQLRHVHRPQGMSALAWITAITAICLGTIPSQAQGTNSCGLQQQPAATLLLPYFEVDLSDASGKNTLFSVGNVQGEPTLAHAVVWTNWGNPILSFDFFVPSEGLLAMSVRDLLEGNLPKTSPPQTPPAGKFESCQDSLVAPPFDAATVAALLAGVAHPGDGLCHSSPVQEGRLATGYITIDVVRDCSNERIRTPREPEDYFVDGGAGLALNDNLLWGDFYLVDSANDAAQGESMVSLIADSTRFGPEVVCVTEPCPPRIPQTFYSSGQDNRMPLPRTYRTRFLHGGGFDGGTDLLVWLGGTTAPAVCETTPTAQTFILSASVRNEAGKGTAEHEFVSAQHALRVPVGGDLLPIETNFGQADIRGRSHPGGPDVLGPPEQQRQLWVMPLASALGRYGVGLTALSTEDFCQDQN